MLQVNKYNMRFYPIANSLEWVNKLVQWNVKTLQLRIKLEENTDKHELIRIENEIKKSIELCNSQNCQLFVNDHWETAIKYNAFGVHLGYEDIQKADLKAIRLANMRLGLSTHNHEELKFALNILPSYIALGPIYLTKTKEMRFAPQGLERIQEWRKLIPKDIPLIAIGGIQLEHENKIFLKGADSISVVSDFLKADCPELRIKKWVNLYEKYKHK